MLRLMTTAAVLAIASAMPALAQTGNPTGTPAGTPAVAPGTPAPHHANTADRAFIEQLAIGNAAEIDLGNLAAQKGHAQPVREFAQNMVHDHTGAGNQLANLAKADGVPLPNGIDVDHVAVREHLGKLGGADFDAAYMQAQVDDHQKTVQLLEYEIGSGQDAQLRSFAADTLPVVRRHLAAAQSLALEAAGKSPSAATPPAGSPGVGASSSPQTPPSHPAQKPPAR